MRALAVNLLICAYIQQAEKQDIPTTSGQERHGSRNILRLGSI
jgi:hypothetical protein